MDRIKIPRIDDFHLHLRDGEMLRRVIPFLYGLRFALIMPNPEGYGMPGENTPKGILNAADIVAYKAEIQQTLGRLNLDPAPIPLMTLKITPHTTPDDIREAHAIEGVMAAKLYPDGVTTNSVGGVQNIRALDPVFRMMAATHMVLCHHGEKPGVYSLDAEQRYHRDFLGVAERHPTLWQIFEHITDRRTIGVVKSIPRAAATVTLHHMLIQHDDVAGTKCRPHNFCKPLAKHPKDRDAIREWATSGDPQCFLGTDSAPHPRNKKECSEGCAGVFTAPITIPLLVQIFERTGQLENLRAFACENGAEFYNLPRSLKEEIELVREPWTVPDNYNGIVPFMAGQQLDWRVINDPINSVWY